VGGRNAPKTLEKIYIIFNCDLLGGAAGPSAPLLPTAMSDEVPFTQVVFAS
jgi:hypothetical protein